MNNNKERMIPEDKTMPLYPWLVKKIHSSGLNFTIKFDFMESFTHLLSKRLDLKELGKTNEDIVCHLIQEAIPINCHIMRSGIDHTRDFQHLLSYKISYGVILEFATATGLLVHAYDEREIYRRNHGKFRHVLDNPFMVQVTLYHRYRKNYKTQVVFLPDCIFVPASELDSWIESYQRVIETEMSLIRYVNLVTQDGIKNRLLDQYGNVFGSIKIGNSLIKGWFIHLTKTNRVHPWDVLVTPRLGCDYTFPEDPIFSSYPSIQPVFKRGRIASCEVNGKIIYISGHAIRRFASRFKDSEIYKHRSKFPELMEGIGRIKSDTGIGIYILLLFRMLERSHEVKRRNSVLQLIQYGFQDAKYFSSYGWVFVIVEDFLSTCYEKGDIFRAGYKSPKKN